MTNFFFTCSKIKLFTILWYLWLQKMVGQKNFSPLLLVRVLDPGSEIRDPGWVKIRIRDKHPGSATLLLGLINLLLFVFSWRTRLAGSCRPRLLGFQAHTRPRLLSLWLWAAVLRIHEILVRIRIRGFIPLTNRSGSSYFRQWPSRRKKSFFAYYYFLKVRLRHFSKIKSHKEVTKQ